nr:hypothetical protein [Tanacetum cinerariifolium]
MDPNLSLGKICLGDDVIVILSNKVEGSGDWISLEYQDTAGSKGKKVLNALSFYKMETDEVKEDDVEPGVILGRSFMRPTKGIIDFGNRVITIYPEPDPFDDDSEKTEKSLDDWDQLLDFNYDDIPEFGEELPLLERTIKSDSDDEEEYQIKRNKFGAPIYGSKPAQVHNKENGLEVVKTIGTHYDKARSSRSKCPRQHETMEDVLLPQVHHEFLLREGCNRYAKSRLHKAGSDKEIFTLVAWIRAFNRTTGYDKIQKNDLWLLSMFDARQQNGVLTKDVVRSLSALICCRDLDTFTLRDLIDSDGKLIPKDLQPGVPRVGIHRPQRASMQDLYDRMGRMEISQEAIERMENRQSYH